MKEQSEQTRPITRPLRRLANVYRNLKPTWSAQPPLEGQTHFDFSAAEQEEGSDD